MEKLSLSDVYRLPDGASVFVSKGQLISICQEVEAKTKESSSQLKPVLEYVKEPVAIEMLGGVSGPTFRRIKKKYGIKNYSPCAGRTLYRISEIYAAIEQAAKERYTHKKADISVLAD